MKRYFYYDLHCHTTLSPDAPLTIKGLVKMAKRRGLDGVAITNHNKAYKGEEEIDGIQIIPGIEVDVKGGVHLLGYFTTKEIEKIKTLRKRLMKFILKEDLQCGHIP
jgi:predicted metal-dependent phosphoesterase TrpH